MTSRIHVTFICMGNICRSPTAHGVLRQKVAHAGLSGRVGVDSAGTHGYHAGAPPDLRSQSHARRRGYDLSDLRARQLGARDFEAADLLLVMDEANLMWAMQHCPSQHRAKLRRLTEFCRARANCLEVPDPYYGGPADFENVLDLVEDACEGLLNHLRARIDVDR